MYVRKEKGKCPVLPRILQQEEKQRLLNKLDPCHLSDCRHCQIAKLEKSQLKEDWREKTKKR